ncbi:hypothetical protein ACLB2K_052602 [Fragaria x ananassa]
MASPTSGGRRSSSRENTAKNMVSDQISQAVLSTSNLLHLMQQSSPSQAQLIKLPKNLLLKSSAIKNTGHLLEQMPRVISSLDAHMETGLQSLPHLQTVIQLLAKMESCQLTSLSKPHVLQEVNISRSLTTYVMNMREKTNLQTWSNSMHYTSLIEDCIDKLT